MFASQNAAISAIHGQLAACTKPVTVFETAAGKGTAEEREVAQQDR